MPHTRAQRHTTADLHGHMVLAPAVVAAGCQFQSLTCLTEISLLVCWLRAKAFTMTSTRLKACVSPSSTCTAALTLSPNIKATIASLSAHNVSSYTAARMPSSRMVVHSSVSAYVTTVLPSSTARPYCTATRHGPTALPYSAALLRGLIARPYCAARLHCPTARPCCTVLLRGPTAGLCSAALLLGPAAGPDCAALLHGPHARPYCAALRRALTAQARGMAVRKIIGAAPHVPCPPPRVLPEVSFSPAHPRKLRHLFSTRAPEASPYLPARSKKQ